MARLDPKRRSDPKVLAWARKQGRTVADGKVTPDAVREYDAQQAKAAAKAAKNWFPDLKTVYHDYGEGVERGQHVIDMRDTSGKTFGWFDPAKKEVHLLPGADAKTVAHEVMWHGTRDWAKRAAAQGDARAAEEGEPGFDLDWEEARAAEHDRAGGLLEGLAEAGLRDELAELGLMSAARGETPDGVRLERLRDGSRSARSAEEARDVLRAAGVIGRSLTNEGLGLTVVISNRDVAKMTSEKAVKKSVSPRLHTLAVANADKVFEAAFVDGTHADTHGRKEVRRTHRLGSAVYDPASGRFEPVLVTVLEYVKDGTKMYTVEAIDVAKYENSAGQLAAVTVGERQAPIAEFVKSIANRVAEVNGGAAKFSVGRLYTGSAADYERPSLVHVGSGEGSQVYGWGLYASDRRGIAEEYARTTKKKAEKASRMFYRVDGKRVSEAEVAESEGNDTAYGLGMVAKGHSRAEVADYLNDLAKGQSNPGSAASLRKAARFLREHEIVFEKQSAPTENVYEQTFFTDRAPGDESHLLKWYEPVSEEQLGWILRQAEKEGLVEKFESEKKWKRFNGDFKEFITDDGRSAEAIYERLSESGLAHSSNKYRDTSEFLARAGIDGVKYPADSYGGKGVKDGDEAGWNYVSFRDDNIRVDHKWTDGVAKFAAARLEYALKEMRPVETHRVASSYAEARTALAPQVGKTFRNKETGVEATLSNNSVNKLLSGKAVAKSVGVKEHLAAVANVTDLFENGRLLATDEGSRKGVLSAKRFFSRFRYNGEDLIAKTTVLEYERGDHRIYSVEAMEVEKAGSILAPKGSTNQAENPALPSTPHIIPQSGPSAQGGAKLAADRIYSVEGIKIAALSPTVRRAIADHNSADNAASLFGSMPNSGGDVNGGAAKFSVSRITPEEDAAYLDAVKRGDMEAAQRLLKSAWERSGYSDDTSYKDAHAAPCAPVDAKDFRNAEALLEARNEGWDLNLWAVAKGITGQPDDFFSDSGPRLYGYDDAAGRETQEAVAQTIDLIRAGADNAKIIVYRAVPKSVKLDALQSGGQWVSPSRTYAENHGKSRFGHGKYRIVREVVRADELWWDGNDAREWGYDDGRQYVYMNGENGKKLATVTYDGAGNLIPLSERFNPAKGDIKFSVARGEDSSVRIAPAYADALTFSPASEQAAKTSVKAWRGGRKIFTNARNGRRAEIKSDWSKIFSTPAKKKSVSYEAHYAAANHIDTLFERSVKMWEEPPRNGSNDIRAYAKYGCPFSLGGETYLAKITVKEYADRAATDGLYSVEAISVEKISAEGINAGITSLEGHELDLGATDALSEMLMTAPRIVPQSGPSAQGGAKLAAGGGSGRGRLADAFALDPRAEVLPGGVRTPGGLASSRELSSQGTTPLTAAGRVHPMALPVSEMVWLYRELTGSAVPPRAGGLSISADVFGIVDRTDAAREKARLKEHGFYRDEDADWCASQTPAAVRAERRPAGRAAAAPGRAARTRRGGGRPGGRARRVRARAREGRHGDAAHGRGRRRTRAEDRRRRPPRGRRVRAGGRRGRGGRDARRGGDVPRLGERRAARGPGDGRARRARPVALAARADGRDVRRVPDDAAGDAAFRELSLRGVTGRAHEAVAAEIRRSMSRATAARLAELERAANEPISAGSAQDDAKETVLVALHDRMAPVVVRIDAKAKVLLKAKREALAARQ